ncbi:MAG: right-handed parallel beta-helix repeat-containing protein [Deltaproteobacteria bacterium]|nr:MAG: right-handed parallel beta-helix repeat-containing protein [Deltaproteobacteria bacterium]
MNQWRSKSFKLWALPWQRTVWLLALLVCVSTSCQNGNNTRACVSAGDCLAGEVCDSQTCEGACRSNKDCLTSQRCDVSSGRCRIACSVENPCAAKQLCHPTSQQCVEACQSDSDCSDTPGLCSKETGQSQGHCKPFCQPGGEGPDVADCLCPSSWEWVGQHCRPACAEGMARNSQHYCIPQLSTLAPTFWENDAKGEARLRCGSGWQRDEQGVCQLTLPPMPTVPRDLEGKAGPQKPCPEDKNYKWDEEYRKRANVPASTPVLFVDPSASVNGDGSRSKPLVSLASAINKASGPTVVLLAPGDYPWDTKIEGKHIHLVGRCTTDVRFVSRNGTERSALYIANATVVLEGFSIVAGNARVPDGLGIYTVNTTVTLRHLRILQPRDFGVYVEGKSAVVENLEISGVRKGPFSDGLGLYLNKMSGDVVVRDSYIHDNGYNGIHVQVANRVLVERCRVEGNNRLKFQAGVFLTEIKTDISLQNNHILNNHNVGVIVGRSSRASLQGNLIVGNGRTASQGSGVQCNEMEQVTVQGNQILQNSSMAVNSVDVKNLVLLDNLFQENSLKHSDKAGVYISQSFQSVLVRGNRFRRNRGNGLLVASGNGKEIVVEKNEFMGTKNASDVEDGIVIDGIANQPYGNVKIEGNLIQHFSHAGVQMRHVQDVTVSFNRVEHNGSTHEFRGLLLQGIKGLLTLEGNDIQKNQHSGVELLDVTTLVVQGNRIVNNTLVSSPSSIPINSGLSLFRADGDVLLQHNVFQGATEHGVSLSILNKSVSIIENRFEQNGLQSSHSYGLTLLASLQPVKVMRNAVVGNGNGAWFGQTQDVELQNNVWAAQSLSGVTIDSSSGVFQMHHEHFADNAGSHLRVVNNQSKLTIQQSSFVGATSAPARPEQGIPPSHGTGIWVGARGLVRWVFAKADYSCSPTQKGWLSSLSDGWTRRPVRVPYELDPCQAWEGKSEEERLKLGACQTCREQGKECRWVWNDSVASAGQGFWQPQPGVQCVEPGQPHTCEDVTSFENVSLRPIRTLFNPTGECGTLEETTKDPCKTNACGDGLYCLRQRFVEQGKPRISSLCSTWERLGKYCYQPRCSNGTRCVVGQSCPDGAVCKPQEYRCPQGQVCYFAQPVFRSVSSVPSRMHLENSLFWGNPGPDVLMDMAGRVVLENNKYLCTTKDGNCALKKVYRDCKVSGENANCKAQSGVLSSTLGHEALTLPQGAMLVWQNPSPYDTPFDSKLEGSDVQRLFRGNQLLFLPDQCNVLASP